MIYMFRVYDARAAYAGLCSRFHAIRQWGTKVGDNGVGARSNHLVVTVHIFVEPTLLPAIVGPRSPSFTPTFS